MSERTGIANDPCHQTNPTKMPANDLGTRKTLFVLVIVVGCFAVLWPKVFYPMLVGPTNSRMKPSVLDKDVKQERPSHLRPEMLHPALRERGSAIVQPYQPPTKSGHPKFVEGRPGPVPGVRPPMGGAGHMVHSPKSSNSMGVIMPIYTIGIVIFFSYTLMKLLFKKKPEGAGPPLYPTVEPSATFRKEVFEPQKNKSSQGPTLIGWKERDARDEELDHLRRRLRETELAMERIVVQMAQVPLRSQKEEAEDVDALINGCTKQPKEQEQPSVKILGMEMTASCEGGQKWERSKSPVIPHSTQAPPEPSTPPQEIFLEGTLPAQSQILVADSTVEEETNSISSSLDPPVVLASKMTLSVISLDTQENGNKNEADKLQNGHVTKYDEDLIDDVVDTSKYTTASGTTAAECDISDEEGSDINEEIENVDEDALDNGVEEIDDMHDETDDNSLDEMEVEEIEEIIIFEDDIIDSDDFLYEDEGRVDRLISQETVEDIGNFIDEIITDGARRLEAEKDIDNNVISDKLEHSTELREDSNVAEEGTDVMESPKIKPNEFTDDCDITNKENDNIHTINENDNIEESPLLRTDNHFSEINDNYAERHTSDNKNVHKLEYDVASNLEEANRIKLDTTEVEQMPPE